MAEGLSHAEINRGGHAHDGYKRSSFFAFK